MFKVGPLYEANLKSKATTVINQGGTSSAKTYEILHTLFTKLAESSNEICTVVGQDIPNLKAGALRDALNIYNDSEILQSLIRSYNKTDRIFEFWNGSIMEFKSYENAQDAKSGKRSFLFVNEANGILYAIYQELSLRTTKQEFIDYNPNAEFWVHENLIGKPNVELLISDHRHNPFCLQRVRDKIEALKNEDYELWKVYARGMTGKIEGLVFRNWIVCDEIPKESKYIGSGLDFGFTNDPTSLIEVWQSDGELYIDEMIYETGLTNPDIAKIMESLPFGKKRRNTVADSADPKSIRELYNLGFSIEPAKKGPDSVKNGIDILKRYKMNVTRRSVNLRKELNNYKWKIDRQTGKATNEPIDAFNHAIDSIRYVAASYLTLSGKGKARFTH